MPPEPGHGLLDDRLAVAASWMSPRTSTALRPSAMCRAASPAPSRPPAGGRTDDALSPAFSSSLHWQCGYWLRIVNKVRSHLAPRKVDATLARFSAFPHNGLKAKRKSALET